MLSALRVLGGLCGSFLFVATAAAQPYQTLGKAKCINCHDHENEKTWSEKKDGPPPNNHLNALRQLEMPKAEAFAKAIGLADPYDATAMKSTSTGISRWRIRSERKNTAPLRTPISSRSFPT